MRHCSKSRCRTIVPRRLRCYALLGAVLGSSLLGPSPSLGGPGGDLSFTARMDFGVGRHPQAIAVGDFNADGIGDLAVANYDSGNVSILLGRGDGTFGSAQNFKVGSQPQFIAVGDFNGDGIPDLAVANYNSGNVSILLGKGDGTFGSAQNFKVGAQPQSIAVGDFNGDGIPDLAVANYSSNNVSILLGKGDGTFESAKSVSVRGQPTSVAAGDFNSDGFQDLVVTSYGNSPQPSTVAILLGNGDGTFRPPQTFAVGVAPLSVSVADFNGDGIPDLAVVNSQSDNVSILLGKGDGTFAPAQSYSVGGYPQSIAVADFNGDGIPDLVTAEHNAAVSILIGNGDGTFQATRDFGAGALPAAVAVGDFNGDGRADVVVADFDANNVSVLINNTPQPGDGVTIVRGLAYYDGPGFNPQKHVLDVYLPALTSDLPVVFLVHGGGWERGNQTRFGYLARTLARAGLGVVAITHRLTDGTPQQVRHPGHIEDVARAFAWTYNHMADYGANVEKIVLLGHSAGAHLISLLATDGRYLAAHGLSTDLIKGVIPVSGIYDLRNFGASGFSSQQEWDASPLKYVGERQPPFQILYADADLPGLDAQAKAFYQALVKANSEAELIQIRQRTHITIMSRTALPGDPAREAILRFIAAHTGG